MSHKLLFTFRSLSRPSWRTHAIPFCWRGDTLRFQQRLSQQACASPHRGRAIVLIPYIHLWNRRDACCRTAERIHLPDVSSCFAQKHVGIILHSIIEALKIWIKQPGTLQLLNVSPWHIYPFIYISLYPSLCSIISVNKVTLAAEHFICAPLPVDTEAFKSKLQTHLFDLFLQLVLPTFLSLRLSGPSSAWKSLPLLTVVSFRYWVRMD